MELFERLEQELGFAYIIRFKENILVGYPEMEQVAASNWLTPTGRTRTLKEVEPSFRTCLKHYQSLDSDRLL